MGHFQRWSRGRNGEKQSVEFYVDDHEAYGENVTEPTGTVAVSIEVLTGMLKELDFFKEDSWY